MPVAKGGKFGPMPSQGEEHLPRESRASHLISSRKSSEGVKEKGAVTDAVGKEEKA